jgi:hypothetical protein
MVELALCKRFREFIENIHKDLEEVEYNTSLQYFPANTTELTQPCDQFVISKIKETWREKWYEYLLIAVEEWASSFLEILACVEEEKEIFPQLRKRFAILGNLGF